MSSDSDSDRSLSETPFTTPCASPPTHYRGRTHAAVVASLHYGGLDFSFRIPHALHVRTTQLIDQCVESLKNNEPRTVLGLVVKFLRFATDGGVDNKQQALDTQIVATLLVAFEQKFSVQDDIHCLAISEAASLEDDDIVAIYLKACALTQRDFDGRTPALLRAVDNKDACVYTIFGGQGNSSTYFEDIRALHATYTPLVAEFVTSSAELLSSLSRNDSCQEVFSDGFDVLKWIQDPSSAPNADTLVSAPYSFPLIGLLQLANYMVICKAIGETPCTFRRYLSGSSGHSQGIIAAVVAAIADSWDSFEILSKNALTILFWIGVRSHQTYPPETLSPASIKDFVDHGEGVPTPMLSVRDMSRSQLQEHIDKANSYFSPEQQISIGLVNNGQNFVVVGPARSLRGLSMRLRLLKAAIGEDQSRVPFSDRKPTFSHSFLPISAPFHSSYLSPASEVILEDVKEIQMVGTSLRISVFSPSSAEDLSRCRENIIPLIVRAITEEVVDWPAATKFTDATHILEFGPGGASGIGMLTHRNKEGRGVRIIIADRLSGPSRGVGYRPELLSRRLDEIRHGTNWAKVSAPRLLQTPAGTIVDTKLSKVLGLPPLIIAGMTPTTVHWDVVAAAMNAGFHIELAAGGYHRAEDLECALLKLEKAIPQGRGITVNVIYASPQAIAWQIPLLAKLRSQGVPIDGLTVGAGVPSPDIAQSYITSIGLKHISFKPGSITSIDAVISIAKANPRFPIILQWTGGRGGGHHSFEDFHQPILATYSNIRLCPNLILVAGSGFGGVEDTYPYLTGSWSTKFGYQRMPFDGFLFGSRLMVAKEAHTSHDTKLAIISTPGLLDSEWEKTYKGIEGAGGLITVISEMGEPIHMLATRGARFWAEMDQIVFKLPVASQVETLKQHKKYIVKKLNDDFQRVWFGRNSEGRAVELEGMTYEEVLNRVIELMYIRRNGKWQWIDKSYEKFMLDLIYRVEERFRRSRIPTLLAKLAANEDPHQVLRVLLIVYPTIKDQLIIAQDIDFFLEMCQRRGQKPVPFIPVLDKNFQTYFKKDSLWQSEDLEAVVGQDVGRTCVLHGPVAARHSEKSDESIKTIMNRINGGHINKLIADAYDGSLASIPSASLSWTRRGNKQSTLDALSNIHRWTVSETEDKHIYRVPYSEESQAPAIDSWLHLLAGSERNWREVLFLSDVVMKGHRYQRNPIKDIFAPVSGHVVEISDPNDQLNGCVALKMPCSKRGEYVKIASVEFWGKLNKITLTLWSPTSSGVSLPIRFSFNPKMGNVPIHENLETRQERVRRFYWQTWFGVEEYDVNTDVSQIFYGDKMEITARSIQTFARSVGYRGEAVKGRSGTEITAPIDYAIVVAWKAITKPLFCASLEGSLLDLVHLSNDLKMIPGATPLKAGETALAMSRVTAIINQDSGRMVEVTGTITRQNSPVIEIVSRFLFRGTFNDFSGTFQTKTEAPRQVNLAKEKDVAILLMKPWISLEMEDAEAELLGKTLTFRLSTTSFFKDKTTLEISKTTGSVEMESQSGNSVPISTINYKTGETGTNLILDYLKRRGTAVEQPFALRNPIPIKNGKHEVHVLAAPSSNEAYAEASGDTNPIHISSVFAQYVNLPGTITHGMWTSAAVRGLLEHSDNHSGRVRSWNTNFTGMVLPKDTLHLTFSHTAMFQGLKVIKVEARKAASNELVLSGECEVEQPATAYIFTGQGSQRKGMGMDLREKSAVARAVWDRADDYFMETYGFAITHIVKNDPKELTIHFGGVKGKRIRQNYMNLSQETTYPDGMVGPKRLLPEITERSTSYTFRSPIGLLSATQFTQPALTLMEIALFEDMSSKGLVGPDVFFAGHSLGEYAALAALGGGILPIEVPAAITFFRGLAMQMNVERDATGRSNYSMCAVNPSKIPNFDEANLRNVVDLIGEETGWLVQIVNFNIRDAQYILAGDVRALSLFTDMANHLINLHNISAKQPSTTLSPRAYNQLVHRLALATTKKPKPLDYQRGPATVPLKQIDVPFHSSFLSKNIPSYRQFLKGMIRPEKVDPSKLVGKWVPNITGRKFGIERRDFEELEKVTGSARCGEILADWEAFERRRGRRTRA